MSTNKRKPYPYTQGPTFREEMERLVPPYIARDLLSLMAGLASIGDDIESKAFACQGSAHLRKLVRFAEGISADITEHCDNNPAYTEST